jgi:hypothetical protein
VNHLIKNYILKMIWSISWSLIKLGIQGEFVNHSLCMGSGSVYNDLVQHFLYLILPECHSTQGIWGILAR